VQRLHDGLHQFPHDLFPRGALHGHSRSPHLGQSPSIGWVIASTDSQLHQAEFLTVEVRNLVVIVGLPSKGSIKTNWTGASFFLLYVKINSG
jgi:hypothetical protein